MKRNNIIEDNLYLTNNSFLYELTENSLFVKDKFLELLSAIRELSLEIEDSEVRSKKGNCIWELWYSTQSKIIWHLDDRDSYKLIGLDSSMIKDVVERMFYSANFFVHKKHIDIVYLMDW
jgi:hypothetical protein